MVLSCPFIDARAIRESWRSAIGYGPGPLCTDVKGITENQGALRYLAKYVSKQCALDITAYRNSGFTFGRTWGVTRKDRIPLAPVEVHRELLGDDWWMVLDFINRKCKNCIPTLETGTTLFGLEAATKVAAYIKDLDKQKTIG
jgi:hypothetical protein